MRILSRIKVNPDTFWDAAGAFVLFATLGALSWIAFGLELPVRGDQLMMGVR